MPDDTKPGSTVSAWLPALETDAFLLPLGTCAASSRRLVQDFTRDSCSLGVNQLSTGKLTQAKAPVSVSRRNPFSSCSSLTSMLPGSLTTWHSPKIWLCSLVALDILGKAPVHTSHNSQQSYYRLGYSGARAHQDSPSQQSGSSSACEAS